MPQTCFLNHKWQKPIAAKVLLSLCLFLVFGCRKAVPPETGPVDFRVHVVMRQWAIEPAQIEIPLGARVEMRVSSADVEHGIAIPQMHIREAVHPGQDTILRFHATESGRFYMYCHVLCGKDHDRMTGWILVQSNGKAVHKE